MFSSTAQLKFAKSTPNRDKTTSATLSVPGSGVPVATRLLKKSKLEQQAEMLAAMPVAKRKAYMHSLRQRAASNRRLRSEYTALASLLNSLLEEAANR